MSHVNMNIKGSVFGDVVILVFVNAGLEFIKLSKLMHKPQYKGIFHFEKTILRQLHIFQSNELYNIKPNNIWL